MSGIPEFPIPRARYTYSITPGGEALLNRNFLVTKVNRAVMMEGHVAVAEFDADDIYRVNANSWRLGLIGPTILQTTEPTMGLKQISISNDWGSDKGVCYVQLDIEGILHPSQTSIIAWRSDKHRKLPDLITLRRMWVTRNDRVVGVLEPDADGDGGIADVRAFLRLWDENEERRKAPLNYVYHLEYLAN